MKGPNAMLMIGIKPKAKPASEEKSDKSSLLMIGKKSEPEEGEDPTKEARLAAASALAKAVKSGDASGIDEALKTHYELCAESHASESYDDEGDDY